MYFATYHVLVEIRFGTCGRETTIHYNPITCWDLGKIGKSEYCVGMQPRGQSLFKKTKNKTKLIIAKNFSKSDIESFLVLIKFTWFFYFVLKVHYQAPGFNECSTQIHSSTVESVWVPKYWVQIFQNKACQMTID